MATDLALLQLTRKVMEHGPRQSGQQDGSQELFDELLTHVLQDRFSEQWYMEQYPDVADAIENKDVPSGLRHFVSSGVYEGRIPFAVAIDERNYALTHLDVAKSVNAKVYKSCTDHYHKIGYQEDRQVVIREPDNG